MKTVLRAMAGLFLALTLSLTLLGCGEEGATGGKLTQEEIEQIVADAATANADVDTLKFDMDMLMTMEVVAEDGPGEITVVVDGNGALDKAEKEMQIIMNMVMDIPDQAKQDMAMELYATGGWMYMGIDIPGLGKQWMKMMLTEEMWQSQSQIDQQIELLRTATEVTFLGSEDVEGTACYVVEIVPSMEALSNLLSQQQTLGMEGIDLGQLNLADLFKEMSVKEWIARDGYLLTKSEVHMVMEMSPADVGTTEEDFEKMTMDINMGMRLYDYHQAVSIELPEEALQAPEVPGT